MEQQGQGVLRDFTQRIETLERAMVTLRDALTEILGTGDLGGAPRPNRLPTLTNQEKRILALISQDKKSGEIAKLLKLSKRTIEAHRYNMQRKLGLKSSAELRGFARENGEER